MTHHLKATSIGIAAFATRDWREKGYPLDLWLTHHAPLFDQVSIVTYGDFPLPFEASNVKVTRMGAQIPRNSFKFFTLGMQLALDALDTDWKILLSIDEFLATKPDLRGLDERYIYPLVLHQLFGGLDRELLWFERYWMYAEYKIIYRIFHSRNKFRIIGDGLVAPKRYWRLPLGLYAPRAVSYAAYLLSRRSRPEGWKLAAGLYYTLVSALQLGRPYAQFDVWHTTFLRPRQQFLIKLQQQRPIHEAEGDTYAVRLIDRIVRGLQNGDFCSNPDKYLNGVYVAPVDRRLLPRILVTNEDRFRVC